jgi:plasmid stability protein
MRDITAAVPDDVYRTTRVKAAERGTSVSALVAEYLRSLADEDAEFERLQALQDEVIAEVERFSASARVERDAVHGRAVR